MASYGTNFAGTENPINESSAWRNGAAIGLDWLDMQKNGVGLATSPIVFSGQTCIACLAAAYAPNQTVTGDCVVNNSSSLVALQLAVDLSITPNSITGYVAHYSPSQSYILRYNGARADTTVIVGPDVYPDGGLFTLATGHAVRLKSVNGLLTSYINTGVGGYREIHHITDNTYTTGTPGFGSLVGVGQSITDLEWSGLGMQDDAGSGHSVSALTTAYTVTGTDVIFRQGSTTWLRYRK